MKSSGDAIRPTTEDRIFSAALRLFAEKGYQGTGIREIAEAVNISSAALYHYMGSKTDLLGKVMKEALLREISALLDGSRICSDVTARLVAFVRIHVVSSGHYRREWIVLEREMPSLTAEYRAMVIALRDRIDRLLDGILADGQRQHIFQIADLHLARFAIIEMCNGVSRWFMYSGPAALEEIADCFSGFALSIAGARRSGQAIRLADIVIEPCAYFTKLTIDRFEHTTPEFDSLEPASIDRAGG